MEILVVDDEKPAREKILAFLADEDGILGIREAENGREAIEQIQRKKPDLVFLDIQMPGKSGFDVITDIGIENMPSVIFVTAYDQYAINAFEIQAIDYLLKPYDQERFRRAFHRASQKHRDRGYQNRDVLENLLKELQHERGYLKKVMVRRGDRIVFIKTDEITHISAEEKYIKIHAGRQSYLLRDTMNRIEGRLNPTQFVRTHRSYIVNTDYIREIQPWTHGDYIILMTNGDKVKLSRRYSESVLEK